MSTHGFLLQLMAFGKWAESEEGEGRLNDEGLHAAVH